jgi:hypothetical protein
MTITIENYFQQYPKRIDTISTSAALQKAHDFVSKSTVSGTDYNQYYSSAPIKSMIDVYSDKLNTLINKKDTVKETVPKVKKDWKSASVEKDNAKKATKRNTAISSEKKEDNKSEINYNMVERLPEELRYIRRFLSLHDKEKDKDDLLRFINALQKSILEKRIRKTSPYADQIVYIQDSLIKMYNSMKGRQKMSIKKEVYETMKSIAGAEKVLPAISFIKSYIGMNAKSGMKERASRLLTQIDRAYEKGKVGDNTPYFEELNQVKNNLQDFISGKGARTLEIEKSTLNGLKGIVKDCSCGDALHGIGEAAAKPSVMNSMDFSKMKFSTIGLEGKWLDFIGDPSPGFTAMVSGKPKFGKSTLCVDFAGYLAKTQGPVLYVATEEGLNRTLQDKLELVKQARLTVASVLPDNLRPYEYIFLDSVTRLKLSPDDLRKLKADNPGKSFIYIFQVTKDGRFRGANDFQHDVDVVIDVPEKGRATQMGRFNQGGEMNIF